MPAVYDDGLKAADASSRQRLFFYNAGFLRQARVRRILTLAGYDLRLGRPAADDLVAVWGKSRYAYRGEAMARRSGAGLLRIEDAFLRSLFPGRSGSAPIGLNIDRRGVHFDSAAPSDLEHILAHHPLDDTGLLDRARAAIARIKEAELSKYSGFETTAPMPDPGYVLVIDQTRGDASVTHGRADSNSFREMLYYAQEDHPGARIVIKTHPETLQGFRGGYFSAADVGGRIELCDAALSPWQLFEGAVAVYVVSSQMGFEAILAGHRPVVFGQPFYAGWNLSDDRNPVARRTRRLTAAQLFAAAMILYPVWYDPCRNRLCEVETAIDCLEAETRAWREDHAGWTAHGMRLWKRAALQKMFGRYRRVVFDGPGDGTRREMIWGGKADAPPDTIRIEDGFLRSRGLGAELIPPLSLVCDDLGIYYDPARASRLERMIASRADLRIDQERRAERLIAALRAHSLSKYNLGTPPPNLPEGHRILVPGQVEDDASILLGAGETASNLELLRRVRAANPQAVIIYKPHPDVEAGLRPGAIGQSLDGLADVVLSGVDPAALLNMVEEVWTMTSLLGFEALLRGCSVTTTGAPFYAGWGLTRDLGDIPPRRRARVSLAGLVHATLVDYPRYYDPISDRPCPVEVVVERLAKDALPRPGMGHRALSKLQGIFASQSWLWR